MPYWKVTKSYLGQDKEGSKDACGYSDPERVNGYVQSRATSINLKLTVMLIACTADLNYGITVLSYFNRIAQKIQFSLIKFLS